MQVAVPATRTAYMEVTAKCEGQFQGYGLLVRSKAALAEPKAMSTFTGGTRLHK